jgi:hypothetical protein
VSPRTPMPEEHGGRVEQALYLRCRRGEAAALLTLAYQLMDRLYTAASFVAPDEASAKAAVVLAWEDTLDLLSRPRVGGYLHARALQCLGRRLSEYADRRTIRRALQNAAREADEALLPLPEEAVKALVDLARGHAADLAAAHRERDAWRRRIGQSLGAAVLLTLIYAGWLALGPGSSSQDVALSCLQQRIVRQETIENLRDFVAALPDPGGADQTRARGLQQVSLALEELVNTRSRQSLRYLVDRIQREDLAAQVTEMAEEYEGLPRQQLMRVQLALEEVQDL